MALDMPAKPKILSVDDILAAPDLPEETVEVPEWGGAVKIKAFTRADVFALRRKAMVGKEVDIERLELLMFITGVVEPKFTEDQAPQLAQKSLSAMGRVLDRINAISGLNDQAAAAADRSFPS